MLYNNNNNFDFIRLIAAFGIIIAHSYALYGNMTLPFYFQNLGEYSIRTFFVISGYLIFASSLRSKNIQEYIKKRFFRIYPALFTLIIISIFILGPIFTTLSLKEYFSHSLTWKYLRNLVFTINYSLPGVFENIPYAKIINGSLWSLVYEIKFYFILALIFVCRWVSQKKFLYIFIITFITYISISLYYDELILSNFFKEKTIVEFLKFIQGIIIFFIGGLLYLFKNIIKFNYKYIIFALITLLALTTFNLSIYYLFCEFLAFGYLIIYFAQLNTAFISNFSRFGDYSYGVYLYGFPVQQLIVEINLKYNLEITFHQYVMLCLIMSLLCAFFSWHLIEKKFLIRKTS